MTNDEVVGTLLMLLGLILGAVVLFYVAGWLAALGFFAVLIFLIGLGGATA